MIMQLFRKKKEFSFERTYRAPVEVVWRAWTEPEMLRRWWGPEKTFVDECDIDLTVGGRIHIVMVADEGMGKYKGTRWPMTGTFSSIEPHRRLSYEARSWTEGEEDTTIEHLNELTLTDNGSGGTDALLVVSINEIGSNAKMAAFGMKWGYKAQLDKLEQLLT